jgi:hypothetical protein
MDGHASTSGASSEHEAFWIDAVYDRECSSDGVSRFDGYVRRAAADPDGLFARCFDGGSWDDDPDDRNARFASAVWEVATGPVMSPGYIRSHGRVLSADVHVSSWDGSLAAAAGLAVPWPAQLARTREWQGDVYWRDWQQQSLMGAAPYWRGPDEEEEARGPHLLTTAMLMFPLRGLAALPNPRSGPGGGLTRAARAAARELVRAMNAVITPVIETIETGGTR